MHEWPLQFLWGLQLIFPGWAQKHCLLLNKGASAHALISQSMSLTSGPSLTEVAQGVGQLEHLLAAHQRHNPIVLGMWVEMAVDAGEPLPSYDERVAAVVASMEVAVGAVGMGASVLGGSGTSTGMGEGSSRAPRL